MEFFYKLLKLPPDKGDKEGSFFDLKLDTKKKLHVDVDLLYQGYPQVSSAMKGLTSEFGMGSGVPPSRETSTWNLLKVLNLSVKKFKQTRK